MLTTIENDYLRVSFDTAAPGGAMCGLYGKKTKTEYLWTGDPAYWDGQAPTLFPICGRLHGGKYTYGGKTYEMGLHGFLWHRVMQVEQKTDTSITFLLKDDEKTRKEYPFAFVFRTTYALEGNTLTCTYTVENPAEDTLIFSLGGHPGFRVPLAEGEKFTDYYLEFPAGVSPMAIDMSENRLYMDGSHPYKLREGRYMPLFHNTFDHDAIFLHETGGRVTLRSCRSPRAVTVAFDTTYVGFWKMPFVDAPFLCIEPWGGLPGRDGVTEDFATKPGMEHLAPHGTSHSYFSITVE